MKISELTSTSKNVELTGTITELSDLHAKDGWQRKDATLQDNSGSVKFQLWDKHVNVAEIGDTVIIKGGYVKEYKGTLSLNVGKYSTVTVVGHEEPKPPEPSVSAELQQDIDEALFYHLEQLQSIFRDKPNILKELKKRQK